MLDHALEYAKEFSVFPCLKDKRPATPNGFKDASRDESVIRGWWTRNTEASIGIPTGAENGIVVLDVDPRNGGYESLARFERESGLLPVTRLASTGGGGEHYWYRYAGSLRSKPNFLPGLDLKADGGYVIVPPSPHPSGNPYQWSDLRPISPIPEAILKIATNGSVKPKQSSTNEPTICDGNRNHELTSLAGAMRRRGSTEPEIVAALLEANRIRCRPPLPDAEVRKIAWSVSRYQPEKQAQVAQNVSVSGWRPQSEYIDFGAIQNKQYQDHAFLIDRVVCKGAVGWIGGPPKLGKSFLALHSAICIATGHPFLGQFEVEQGRALYVSEEDPERISVQRARGMLQAMEIDQPPDSFRMLCKAQVRVDKVDCIKWLRREIEEWRPTFLVMDVFNRLHASDVNSATEMRPILVALDRIREDYGTTIQIVIHFKKLQEGANLDMMGQLISGSLALHAFSECSMYLLKKDGKTRITFEAKEFQPIRDVALTIQGDAETMVGPIRLTCDEVVSQSEKGEQNRQIAVKALMDCFEESPHDPKGISSTAIQKRAEELGGNFTAGTLIRHLKSSGYEPINDAMRNGRGRALFFHPNRRTDG